MKKELNIQTLLPLNYIDYNKDRALLELRDFCGYEYYDAKHFESVLTRFLQSYYLPKKFNIDKRTSHLSSMIVSGQMTREEALCEIEKLTYSKYLEQDIAFIIDKLKISRDQFDKIMALPPKRHRDYKTDKVLDLFNFIVRLKRKIMG